MKPAYALFKRVVAEPLGQATIPSNIEEAQRGMVSTIDTISLDGSENIDIRGWIRTYADSGKRIYVGIYTSFRHEDRGYVSVGFPIPSSNFTATLQPRNVDGDGLLLTSRSDLPFPGHYLSAVEDGTLTVLKLLAFHEQIHVFMDDGELEDRAQLLARRRSASSRCTTRSSALARDHPRGDGVVRRLVDQDERAGGVALLVGVGRDVAAEPEGHVGDVVEAQLVGGRPFERLELDPAVDRCRSARGRCGCRA